MHKKKETSFFLMTENMILRVSHQIKNNRGCPLPMRRPVAKWKNRLPVNHDNINVGEGNVLSLMWNKRILKGEFKGGKMEREEQMRTIS